MQQSRRQYSLKVRVLMESISQFSSSSLVDISKNQFKLLHYLLGYPIYSYISVSSEAILLGALSLQVSDQVLSLLLFLDTSEYHLRSRDVLRRVSKVDIQGIWTPRNSFILVSLRVREAFRLTSLSTNESVKVGTLLVGLSRFDHVALGALLLEDFGSLVCITHD